MQFIFSWNNVSIDPLHSTQNGKKPFRSNQMMPMENVGNLSKGSPGGNLDQLRLTWSTIGLIHPQKPTNGQQADEYTKYQTYYFPANKDHDTTSPFLRFPCRSIGGQILTGNDAKKTSSHLYAPTCEAT
jgi:hypothetical protein